jgi:creatinine amidohydrolase
MKSLLWLAAAAAAVTASSDLPFRWDELTASDWPAALEKSSRTCILPIGILEKHGPHAPIGSDLIHVREWSSRAAKREYAVVFPDYFYGQINEARHQPGTFSLSPEVVWDLLQGTCDEIGRNGFDKIVIVNGHGGNPQLLRYFIQTQLGKRHDYVVYLFDPASDPAVEEKVKQIRKSDPAGDMHACSTSAPTSSTWTAPPRSRERTRSA